jgi:hypothetical protein
MTPPSASARSSQTANPVPDPVGERQRNQLVNATHPLVTFNCSGVRHIASTTAARVCPV